jgi:hypothetical protein
MHLDQNSSAYNSYFKWKKYVQFDKNIIDFSTICDMCIQLQLDSYIENKPKMLYNIWDKKRDCQ